jgi:hypothetical protein
MLQLFILIYLHYCIAFIIFIRIMPGTDRVLRPQNGRFFRRGFAKSWLFRCRAPDLKGLDRDGSHRP